MQHGNCDFSEPRFYTGEGLTPLPFGNKKEVRLGEKKRDQVVNRLFYSGKEARKGLGGQKKTRRTEDEMKATCERLNQLQVGVKAEKRRGRGWVSPPLEPLAPLTYVAGSDPHLRAFWLRRTIVLEHRKTSPKPREPQLSPTLPFVTLPRCQTSTTSPTPDETLLEDFKQHIPTNLIEDSCVEHREVPVPCSASSSSQPPPSPSSSSASSSSGYSSGFS